MVEARPLGSQEAEWTFIRICHLSLQTSVLEDPLAHVGCVEGAAAPAGSVWMVSERLPDTAL